MHKFLPRFVPKLMVIFTSLVLMSLPFTTISYAQDTYHDPVMEAAKKAGLVTDIGQSQTVGDITVTLDWAYADTQNLTIGYTLKTAEGVDPNHLFSPYASPRLSDDKGAQFSYSTSFPTSTDKANEITLVVKYYSQAVIPVKGTDNVDINNDYFNPPPDKLNLKFELTLGDFSPSQGFVPTDTSTKPADYVQPIGPFTFDFIVPLYSAVVIKPTSAQTVTVKNVSMTLEQVTVTPTKTSVRVCYNLPDPRDWSPEGSVTMNDISGTLSGISIVGSKETAFNDTQNRCYDLSFDVFHDTKPAALNINIDHLSVSMGEGPDDWNKIKAELAKHDILIDVISISHGLDVKVLSVPEGIDYDQAVIEAREALGDWIRGPWTFKVDLP
jgi:hypothetical protein